MKGVGGILDGVVGKLPIPSLPTGGLPIGPRGVGVPLPDDFPSLQAGDIGLSEVEKVPSGLAKDILGRI